MRGVFQPTNISWRWMTELHSERPIKEVDFDFKGGRHDIQIVLRYDYLEESALKS